MFASFKHAFARVKEVLKSNMGLIRWFAAEPPPGGSPGRERGGGGAEAELCRAAAFGRCCRRARRAIAEGECGGRGVQPDGLAGRRDQRRAGSSSPSSESVRRQLSFPADDN